VGVSSSFCMFWAVDQPRASSSAMMRPLLEEACLRFRFLPDEEGSAFRYLEARYEESDILLA